VTSPRLVGISLWSRRTILFDRPPPWRMRTGGVQRVRCEKWGTTDDHRWIACLIYICPSLPVQTELAYLNNWPIGENYIPHIPENRNSLASDITGDTVLPATNTFIYRKWAILPLLPSRRASPNFGRYSFPVPLRVAELASWLGEIGLLRCVARPNSVAHPVLAAAARNRTGDHWVASSTPYPL